MFQYPTYTRDRVRQITGRVRGCIYPDRISPSSLLVTSAVDRITYPVAVALPYRAATLGESFGPLWATYWFKLGFDVPAAWAGSRVDLLWTTFGESTLWLDGQPAQGLNTGVSRGVNRDRPDAVVLPAASGGERLDLAIELACNGIMGAGDRRYRSIEPVVLDQCEIARFDPVAWDLYFDLRVLVDLEADVENGLDPAYAGELLRELNRFCNVWDEVDRSTWDEARSILARLYEHRAPSAVHEIHAIGHGHIDTAWLWPIAESHRKCVRTFTTALAYMERYPEYRFACSQAQHYAWVKEEHPTVYERIRARVAAGQWVPVGGSWIEPDCNLPSGESLVRQLLYGQAFFEREFGRRCTEFWNPDVFGYNGQLPQIMRGAGMSRFLTQKLSWNRFTTPPDHSFRWQGIDGSEVTVHFPPADTYNSEADVAELRRVARSYRNHDQSARSLLLFGHGDGGGGPTTTMLEVLRRAADLQGLPRVRQSTADEFFTSLEAETEAWHVVVGELYFEYHRGTYTTQAATKLANRRCEFLVHDVEFLSSIADRQGGLAYPAAEIDELWQTLLVNQFHDILPGSSIALVYEDTAREYAHLRVEGERLRSAALAAIAGAGDTVLPVNTLGVPVEGIVDGPDGGAVAVRVPSYGVGEIVRATSAVRVGRVGKSLTLENEHLRAVVEADGSVSSLVLRAIDRESLAAAGNVFELYDDQPIAYDAWDIDPFHLETRRVCPPAESVVVSRDTPLRAEVTVERRLGASSRLRQVIRLDAGSARLEFATWIDWWERKRLLKVAFPVGVHATGATYEMQFGCVERPTHYSTAADFARYEVPGHRWSDLSEHGFGVAMLSDAKYGYSTHANELRLTLLRASTDPDADADIGEHAFRYAIVPHLGGWREAGIVAEGLRFNHPVLWTTGRAAPTSFASVDDPNLVLDTIKRAECGHELVLRLYEAHGGRGKARIQLGLPFVSANLANLLEDPGKSLPVEEGQIVVTYRPFEIITVVVV